MKVSFELKAMGAAHDVLLLLADHRVEVTLADGQLASGVLELQFNEARGHLSLALVDGDGAQRTLSPHDIESIRVVRPEKLPERQIPGQTEIPMP